MAMKIEKQYIKFIKPFVPTPLTHRQYKLGFLDELYPVSDVKIVLFFSSTNISNNVDPNYVFQFEKSLEKTLTRFYPLAGKYVDENHTIDCNDQGVEFTYAKVNIRVSEVKDDIKYIDEFIPSRVYESLLATQVTTFECGGVAVGVNASHKVVDGSTLSTFLNEWAAMNRDENKNEVELINGPVFNSSSLFPGRGLCSLDVTFIYNKDMLSKYTWKKISFSESVIANMKGKIKASETHRLSKVQLVSSIIWKAIIGIDQETYNCPRKSVLIQPVNLRDKMVSLIPKNSCGNLWALCATNSTALETSEELLHNLSDSVKKTITNFSKVNDLHSEESQMMVLNSYQCLINNPEATDVVWVSSWCKFPFYEADFGFGKPTWVAPGMDPVVNSAYLMDDAQGNGVEAYVFLELKDASYFEQALDNESKIYGFPCV